MGKLAEKHVQQRRTTNKETKSAAPKVIAGTIDLNIVARVYDGSQWITGAKRGDCFHILAKFEKTSGNCFRFTFEKIDRTPS